MSLEAINADASRALPAERQALGDLGSDTNNDPRDMVRSLKERLDETTSARQGVSGQVVDRARGVVGRRRRTASASRGVPRRGVALVTEGGTAGFRGPSLLTPAGIILLLLL